MKAKEFMQKFLSNKYVLMVVTVLAVLNLIGYMALYDFESVVYFILVGCVTYFFSKNMIVVLGVPLIFVNLFRVKSREGMENENTSTMDASANAMIQKINSTKNSGSTTGTTTGSGTTNTSGSGTTTGSTGTTTGSGGTSQFKEVLQKVNSQKASSQQGLPITPLPTTTTSTSNTDTSDATVDESFEVGRSKKNSSGYNIDYASTIEDAYDQLNGILGSDGIKQLTNDTQGLMKQQMQLAESMRSLQPMIEGIGPLMQQAQGFLGGLGGFGRTQKEDKK